MPQVLGDNGDGTWTVQTDDGREVRTAWLPPGLAYNVQTAAPVGQETAVPVSGGAAPAPAQAAPTPVQAPMPDVGAYLAGSAPVAPTAAPVSAYPPTQDVYSTQRPVPYTPTPPVQQPAPEPPKALRPRSDFPEVPPASAQAQASALVPIPFSGGGGADTKALRDAYAQQEQGMREAARVATEQAVADEARLNVNLAAERARAQENNERNAVQLKAQDDFLQQHTALLAQFDTPTGQVDPNRWWKDRTTGQKVSAYISAFLTGFAGRPDVIQQAIDRDIEAQKDTLDRMERTRTQRLAANQGLYGMMRERFGDGLLAQKAVELATLGYQEREAQAAAARFKGPEVQARTQILLGELAEKKARALAEARARAAQLAMAQYEAQLKTQQQAAAQQAQSGAVVPLANLTPELLKRAVVVAPGQAVLAVDEDSAKKARESATSGAQLLRILDTAIRLRSEYGSETLPTEAKKRLQSIGTELVGALNRRNKFGALDKGTQDLLQSMAGGDLTAYGIALPVLQQVREGTLQDLNDEFQVYTGRQQPNQSNAAVRKDAPAKK